MCSIGDDSLRSMRIAEKKLEQTYDRLILKYLDKPSHVLTHLGLPIADHREIFDAECRSETELAVKKLLSCMRKHFAESWLDEFKIALKKTNPKSTLYLHLSLDFNKVLETVANDQQRFENVLEVYFADLTEARPGKIIEILYPRKYITYRIKQEVEAITKLEGDVKGMQALLLRLPYSSIDWFVGLIRALKTTGYHRSLLNVIDPKLSEANSSMSIRCVGLQMEIDSTHPATRRRSSSAETAANASKDRTKSNLTPPDKPSGNVRTDRERQTDVTQPLVDGLSVIDLQSTVPASGKVCTAPAPAAAAAAAATTMAANSCTTVNASYSFSSVAAGNQLSASVKDRLYDKSLDSSSMSTANIAFNRQDSDDNKERTNGHNSPDEEVNHLDEDDVFASLITRVMSEIEEHIKSSPDIEAVRDDVRDLGKLVQISESRCTNDYSRCADKLLHESAKINNQNIRHFFKTTAHHLLVYNKALMIRAACHATDALNYIQAQLTELATNQSLPNNETSLWLSRLYNNMVGGLEEISRSPQGINRNLERLSKMISTELNNGGDTATVGLVLCPSSEVATCVATWMRQTSSLSSFNPVNIDAPGKASQRDVSLRGGQLIDIKQRVKSNVRLIITTSVVAKQHDTKSCSFEVQYSGRSVRLSSRRSRQGDTGATASGAEQSNPDAFLFNCQKCNTLAVSSANLRRVAKVHHVPVDSSFEERATFESHPNPKKSGKWEKTHKISCKGCGNEWGVKATYTVNGQSYNVLTVNSFIIVDRLKQERRFKEWKDAAFLQVQELN